MLPLEKSEPQRRKYEISPEISIWKWKYIWTVHQSSSCQSLGLILGTSVRTRSQNICVSAEPGFSLRAATSLMPTDAIGGLQIGFTTVEAGDFPNGLRCNRQILYIRVCHSAHHQISSFPAHRETGLIKLLFPRIHVLHMNEKAVYFLSGGEGLSIHQLASLSTSPPPAAASSVYSQHLTSVDTRAVLLSILFLIYRQAGS